MLQNRKPVMTPSRRKALSTLFKGTAAVAVVGAGALGWRLSQTGVPGSDGVPFEPWTAFADLPAGDPLSLVGAAILASSPHNTQPWKFSVGPTHIEVHAVSQRRLGAMDPFTREMWLGLGCAVENMVQAAAGKGFAIASLTAAPNAGADHLAARLLLRPAATDPSRSHDAITQRRTNRTDYLPDATLPSAVQDALASAAALSSADARLRLLPAHDASGKAFAAGTVEATRWITRDATMSADGHRWFRANPRAVAEHRDGVTLPTAGLPPLITTVGQLLPEPDSEAAAGYWIASTQRQLASAPWFGVIAVRDLYDRRQQLEAGRLWQRLHLELTHAGLAAQPLNQMPEVVDREKQLGKPAAMARTLSRFGEPGWSPTFAFRFGAASSDVPHSPRRSLADVSRRVPASPA